MTIGTGSYRSRERTSRGCSAATLNAGAGFPAPSRCQEHESESKADRQPHIAGRLKKTGHAVTARHSPLGLKAGGSAPAIHGNDLVVAVHHLAPVKVRIAGETRCASGLHIPRRDHELVIGDSTALVEHVEHVSFELQLLAFADGDLMNQVSVRLNQWIGAGIMH